MDSHASGSSAVISTETVTYGEVHLDVTDCRRTLAFWHDIVGLNLIDRCDKEARLGVDGRTLVVLHHGAEQGFIRGHIGLYHLAIHLPDETEFARVLWRLIVSGYPQSPTDHTMSKSTYLSDPDGLGLELTLETPERLGSWSIEANEPQLIDAEGRSRRIAEPLDVNEVLAHLPNRDFDQPLLPAGTTVGHLHLHVSDLEASVRFYCDLIGFREHMYAPDLGFADLSAGGSFRTGWHSTPGRAQAFLSPRRAARVCAVSPSSFPVRRRSPARFSACARWGTKPSRRTAASSSATRRVMPSS